MCSHTAYPRTSSQRRKRARMYIGRHGSRGELLFYIKQYIISNEKVLETQNTTLNMDLPRIQSYSKLSRIFICNTSYVIIMEEKQTLLVLLHFKPLPNTHTRTYYTSIFLWDDLFLIRQIPIQYSSQKIIFVLCNQVCYKPIFYFYLKLKEPAFSQL